MPKLRTPKAAYDALVRRAAKGSRADEEHLQAAQTEMLQSIAARNDDWSNIPTGLGQQGQDPSCDTVWANRIRLNFNTLDRMYTQNALAARIVDRPPFDMIRQGWTLNLPEENEQAPDNQEWMLDQQKRLKMPRRLMQALQWARLYGTALLVYGLDDGRDLAEPLDENNIREFKSLRVYDRWQVRVKEMDKDPTSDNFEQPVLWEITSAITAATFTVHHTRVSRFDGIIPPDRMLIRNDGFGFGVLDRVFPEVRAFGASFAYAEIIMKDFSESVFKIGNLKQLLSSGQIEQIRSRFRVINLAKSILNAVVIGNDETYEKRSTSVTGLNDLLQEFQFLLGAATGIPLTLLFARSPAGQNATGESDIRNYYDQIKADKTNDLQDPVDEITRLLFLMRGSITNGKEPDGWSNTFNSLWQLPATEQADVDLKKAQADDLNITNNVLLPEEVRASRFGNDNEVQLNEEAYTAAIEADTKAMQAMVIAANQPPEEDPAEQE